MNLLLITWHTARDSFSENGVSAQWVEELAKEHNVTLLTISRPQRYGEIQKEFPDINIIEWSDIRLHGLLGRYESIIKPTYFYFFFKIRKFLKKYLREHQIDLIHHLSPFAWRYQSPAYGLGVPLVRGPIAGGLQIPREFSNIKSKNPTWFETIRNFDQLRLRFDPFFKKAYEQTDHIIFAAPYVRDFFQKFQIKSSSIEIEHGLTSYPEYEEKPATDIVRILYVGRVTPTKGLYLLLQAIPLINSEKPFILDVIGDGESLPMCRLTANELNINDKVNFHGWQEKAFVNDYYRKTDIFVFPTYREPTGAVVLEAMTYGLPVVTCAYGGPDYIVTDGTGIKIPPAPPQKFVEDMAKEISMLIDNEEKRKTIGRKAYQRAIEVFNWNEKIKRINKLYTSLQKSSLLSA
jgi:glycosyltransferase involved in cell wall biosynthesis